MADHFILNSTKVTIQRDSWIYIKKVYTVFSKTALNIFEQNYDIYLPPSYLPLC